MAIYDQEQQKVVVRIVYDGPARAGKTTNMRQLADCFSLRRRSEIYVPEEMDGRTLFFDWMQLDGGLVAGEALRCQFLTVPGQRGLATRRKRILQSADVVVFVCSSARRSQQTSREMLRSLRWSLRSVGREDVPVVVQANKQDLKSALSLDELRESLELTSAIDVVGAAAARGVGVRETAVLAIRAGARAAEVVIRERGLGALYGCTESAEQLLGRLQQLGESTVSSVEILEELLVEEEEEDELRPSAAHTSPPQPRLPDTPAPSSPAITEGVMQPPRPSPDVPTGCIWPSTTGRQVLQALGEQTWSRRPDLVAGCGHEPSGDAGALLYDVGAYCAKTSQRHRYPSVNEGRKALLTLVRRKLLLGDLLAPQTVISVQDDGVGGFWLWTLSPCMDTLHGDMSRAVVTHDAAALGRSLHEFARATALSLRLCAQREVVLALHPSNFCSSDAALFYVDDDIALGTSLPMVGQAILQRVEEHADQPALVQSYQHALRDELQALLAPHQLRRLAVIESLHAASVRHPRAHEARAFLVDALDHHIREEPQ